MGSKEDYLVDNFLFAITKKDQILWNSKPKLQNV
jgi:hypothetical protein